MNEDEYIKKTNYTPVILFFIVIVVIVGGLTSFKKETLICSKTKNLCKVEKVNLFNIKISKNLGKFSDIEDVSFFKQRIKGNRYGKGYKEYLIAFELKNKNKIQIFTKSYYEKKELNFAIKELKSKINNIDDHFVMERGN